ncbi:MAG TPA: circularly permuted type 2 ATP-grasp protein [Solirubrobacteraceae bacterium]|nr:circularly permuted type 2 ATP-grasp protein [Solirubrobacteraceae bacterium]
MRFGAGEDGQFPIDPLPRLLTATEWKTLAAGVAQRLRALDAFVADVYGARRAFAAGVVPEALVASSAFLERDLVGHVQQPWVAIAGLDIVRDQRGALRVLEDNVRTPSGLAYLLAVREVVSAALDTPAPGDLAGALADALRATVGADATGPPGARVLLSDGETNSAWYEHRRLAAVAKVPLVRPGDLRRRGERLTLREDGRDVGVIYRRTDEDRLRRADGSPTALGELLLAPMRARRVRLANGFGTGVADDKRVYPYVEAMIAFYLEEEPLLGSVRTFDLSVAAEREHVLEHLDELVAKPRDGHGGRGVVIGTHASDGERAALARRIKAEPDEWVAQETIVLSTHPTIVDGAVEPRHVDLRVFAFLDGKSVKVLPGGLTRVALDRASMIVNSSRRGGAKDTWVLP